MNDAASPSPAETATAAGSRPLLGRTALITGSTSGIGLGIAHSLAAAGAGIVLNGLGERAAIDAHAAEIAGAYGVPVRFEAADMRYGAEIAAMVAAGEAACGAVDILVNNAGIQHVAPVEDFPDDRWEAIVAINLSAAFYATKAALPGMKSRGFGRIINIASAHGLVASPFKSAYVAAKHGIVGLTKAVGLEVAELNITCNAICPGYVRTPLVEAQIADQARVHDMAEDRVIREIILAAQPNKRFVEIAEIGALAVFLCGPAGRSFNGAALPIEGGWTAR